MTENTSRTKGIARRDLLRKGALGASALVVGGATVGAAETRRQGGAGFLTEEDFGKRPADDSRFEINGPSPFVLEHPAGCSGNPNAPEKQYQGYEIEYQGDTGLKLATLFLESERNVETGVLQDFATTRECPPDATVIDTRTGQPLGGTFPLLKVAFQPAR